MAVTLRAALPVLLITLSSLTLAAGCTSLDDQVAEALGEDDYDQAAQLLWSAAFDSKCPERGQHLLRRAEVQQAVKRQPEALESIEKAVAACPDLLEGYWARAQLRAEMGERQSALDDARRASEAIPEAQDLVDGLLAELELEEAIRDQARTLVETLRQALTIEDKLQQLPDTSPARLARKVPIPMRLQYAVTQEVISPMPFRMAWMEELSYRGEAMARGYTLVRSLDVPSMHPALPVYFRLMMSNQRLPMRFEVSDQGEVLSATWHTNGPDRGMRPEMLRPEVESMLKRRRLFDPGTEGIRTPGDSWKGKDVRIVDGQPVEVQTTNHVAGWVETLGIRTLHIQRQLVGEGYSGNEETWLHPETAVVVRWTREAAYNVTSEAAVEPWTERQVARLLSIDGLH